jgi:chemotaxis-related protein WspB
MLVLTFQIGDDRLALDVRQVCEVVPRVRLQRVAFSPAWLAGVFIYRGRVVPVLDLHQLVGVGECPPQLSSRIILVPQLLDGEERLLGLLAAQVADIRELRPPAQAQPRLAVPGQPDLGPALVDGREIVHVVELDRLLPDSYRRQLALVSREFSA